MRREYKAMAIVCTMLIILSVVTSHAWAAGLHFTDQEIAIWRARKDNGPYKDEWTAILNRATSWKNNPDARWAGNTTGTCWAGDQFDPPLGKDAGLRDAAFVYLLTGDVSYRDAVRKELLAQTAITGTDWTNTQIWCPTAGNAHEHYHPANWVRRLGAGYSYIQNSLPSSDRIKIEKWFATAGKYFDSVIHNVVRKRFPNRYSDDYAVCQDASHCPGSSLGTTHFGGHTVYKFHHAWSNTTSAVAAAAAMIAVIVDDSTLKDHAKRYVKEWLKYGTFPGGYVMDQFRWNGTVIIARGYRYPYLNLGSIITIVDHLARNGDIELYTFETTKGMFGSEGGPKSLLKVLQHYARQTNGTVIEYASTARTTNPDFILDHSMPYSDNSKVVNQAQFVNLTPANLFYNNPEVARAYGTTLPSIWESFGCDMLSGDWCSAYPRIRFMFAQMEGKVWPYPSSSDDTIAPAPPVGLKIISGNP